MNLQNKILKAISKGINEALSYTMRENHKTKHIMELTQDECDQINVMCSIALEREEEYIDDGSDTIEAEFDYGCDGDENYIITINGKNYGVHGYVSQDYYYDKWGEIEYGKLHMPETVSAYELDEEGEEIEDIEYILYLDHKYLPKKSTTDMSSEVCQKYKKEKEEEERIKSEKRWAEEEKRKEEYRQDVLNNREKYIKVAEDLMSQLDEEPYGDASYHAGLAEKIYRILGMQAEAEKARRESIAYYHMEEGPDI